jgi:hypothetical protein
LSTTAQLARMGLVLNVVKDPSDSNIAALRAALADDAHGAGLFVSGADPDSLIASLVTPAMPVMKMADYDNPTVDGDEVVVRGALPAGHQIAAVRLTMRQHDDKIVELLQEVEMPPPPPASPMVIDDSLGALFAGAQQLGAPMVVTYVDGDGVPHSSFRGTVQPFRPDALAMWVRDPNGGLLRAIAGNPHLALLYRDPTSRTHYEINGRASRTDDPVERETIFSGSPPFDQGIDAGRRGVAVIIEVDVLRGGPPASPVNLRRDAQ